MSKKTDQGTDNKDAKTEGGDTLAKCASCETEQPVGHKCCAECGQPMAKAAQVEYDKALTALGDFHKANTALPPKPEVKAGTPDAAVAAVLAKARTGEGDESALVELLIGGQNRNTDLIVAHAEDTRAVRIGMGELGGLLAKAITAGFTAHQDLVLDEVKAMRAEFGEWKNQPGRSRSATVQPTAKSLSSVQTPSPGDELRGEALAQQAFNLAKAGKIRPDEATLTQYYANRGHSLTTLATVEAGLAQRLNAALASETQH